MARSGNVNLKIPWTLLDSLMARKPRGVCRHAYLIAILRDFNAGQGWRELNNTETAIDYAKKGLNAQDLLDENIAFGIIRESGTPLPESPPPQKKAAKKRRAKKDNPKQYEFNFS